MPEKEPKKKLSSEEILHSVGKNAIRLDQVNYPLKNRSLVPAMVQQEDGTISFISEHRFISSPEIIPLTSGPVNPNHN
jgi:hypothetical protein